MKRIRAATFADNLPQWIRNGITDWQLPYQQGRPDESDLILHEGELPVSTALATEPPHTEAVFEEVQRYISNFRFTALSGGVGNIGDYMVPADVLYFHDGSYMLLPHGRGGHVHVVSTQHKVTGEIDQASFQELSIGDMVVCFNMNREIIRHLSREHLSSAYEHLDIWRNCLQSLLNAKSGQFSQLEASLMQQKKVLGLSAGSPTRQNIVRWLYETDMLAPHNSNMWLILRASGLSERDAESALGKIEKAKRLIIRNSSQVSGRIRSRIMTVLRDSQFPEADILLDVDGVSVAVQCGRITDKEKRTDMEVPYASTKRFIKD